MLHGDKHRIKHIKRRLLPGETSSGRSGGGTGRYVLYAGWRYMDRRTEERERGERNGCDCEDGEIDAVTDGKC